MATTLESKDDVVNLIYTDEERRLVHKLRTLLMDLPDDVFRSLNTLVETRRGERWKDSVLLVCLQYSMSYINSAPLQTDYNLSNYPSAWEAPILLGGEIMALFGQAILQTGENFSYSDNGLSLQISSASQYASLAQGMMSAWDSQVKGLKQYLRPSGAGVYGGMAAGGVRIRSYAPRMWVYR